MKKTLLLLSCLLLASANSAMGNCKEHDGEHKDHNKSGHAEHKDKPNLMMLMMKTSPLPVLMPILVKNSEELGLSKEQNEALAKWRTENMAPALTLANEIIEGDKAIKQAALDGKPKEKIEAMVNAVLEKRSEMANKMLVCRDNTKRILSKSQWQKMVKLYRQIAT